MHTILDIAQKAGVSHTTVSRVLNGKLIRCKQQTRDKILRIAAELNYRPNASAQNLKARKYNTLGFLAHDITDMFVVDCIGAIEQALTHTDYRALWVSAKLHGSSDQSALLQTVRALPIDALLVLEADNLIADVEVLKLHARDQMRISTLVRKIPGGHISSVTLDNALGMKLLVDHLISLGHREMAFLPDVLMHEGAIDRFETFKKILAEKKLPMRSEWYQPTIGSVDEGFKAAMRILTGDRKPTAILAFNDLSAFGCIRACEEKGISVPEEISVAGFDDIGMAARYNPNLTTISTDFPAMGNAVITQMLSMIERGRELFKAEHVVIKPKLMVRESTAVPAR